MRAWTVVSGLSALLLLTLAALVPLDGCSDSPAKPVGTLGAACYMPTPRCNAELVCRDNVCVRGPNDASATDGAGGSLGSEAGADVTDGPSAEGGSSDARPADAAPDAPTDNAEAGAADTASSEGGDATADTTEGS